MVSILATRSVTGAPTFVNWVLSATCAACCASMFAFRRDFVQNKRQCVDDDAADDQ